MTATASPQTTVLAEQRLDGPGRRPAKHRMSRKALGWQIGLYTLLIVLALIYIYPFLVQVATSFKTDAAAAADPISLFPQTFTWAAYERLFLNSDFPVWFANSAVVTVFVTAAGCSSTPSPGTPSPACSSVGAVSSSRVSSR